MALFDWDELNFAEIAREQSLTGSLFTSRINYLPFYEKPPLFTWMQGLGQALFGVTPAGARFPNLLCCLASVLALLYLGRRRPGHRFGRWWAAFLAFSLLPALYFQSGIIDPWFNLFIVLGLWPSLTRARLSGRAVLVSGLLLGLAVLTKGPAAGLIAGLCWTVLLIRQSDNRPARLFQYGATGLIALLPLVIWIALLWREDGGVFAREFLDYQWRLFSREDAGHGGFPGYHSVVLLFGCFPASWFALRPLLRAGDFNTTTDRGMRALFWVVLLLFSVVNTKIIHYSSLCYFPVAWFAARAVTAANACGVEPTARRVGLLLTWSLYTILTGLIAVGGMTLDRWLPRVTDPELVSRLSLPVTWPWYTLLPAVIAAGGICWQLSYRSRAPHGYTETETACRQATGHLLITVVFLAAGLITLAPRIQEYTQGAPVAFWQNLAGREVYVGTAYYKSYAHYYHAAIPPERYDRGCRERQCRFHGPTELPLYFASPLRKTDQVLREVPDAELLYRKGGFSFYLRPPSL